jgi:hypothetical protein
MPPGDREKESTGEVLAEGIRYGNRLTLPSLPLDRFGPGQDIQEVGFGAMPQCGQGQILTSRDALEQDCAQIASPDTNEAKIGVQPVGEYPGSAGKLHLGIRRDLKSLQDLTG